MWGKGNIVVAAAGAAFAFYASAGQSGDETPTDPRTLGAFVEVINADTFRFEGGRVQVRGVDAPDPRPWAECDEEAWRGAEARGYARGVTQSATVELTAIHGRQGVGTSWERWLGDITVDGQDFAAMLVQAGHGKISPDNVRVWCPNAPGDRP